MVPLLRKEKHKIGIFSRLFVFNQDECLAKEKKHFVVETWLCRPSNLYIFGLSMNFCAPWTCFFFGAFLNWTLSFSLFRFQRLLLESITHVYSFLCTINLLCKDLLKFMVCLCVLAVLLMLVFGHRKIGWCVVGFANERVNSLSIFTCCKP